MEVEVCPECNRKLDNRSCRLVQDTCGHKKCRICLLDDETKCKLCQEAVQEPRRQNVINHTAVITCQNKICDEIALDVSLKPQQTEYSQNVIASHITFKGESLGYNCNICKKNFTTKSHIKYHSYCAGGKKPFQCETCGKGFIIKSHYQTHLFNHAQKKPFTCDKCGKKFSEKSKLIRHKSSHVKIKTFICQECGKTFKNKENLRTHLIIHRPEKPYKCEKCDSSFSHSSNLKKHLQTHNVEKAHMCDQCGKRFQLKWALTLHRKSHLKVRANECRICKKAFVHAKDLQRHEMIHLDAKGFTCGICGTSFKRKDNLNRHTKNTHPGEQALVIRNVIKKPEQENRSVVVDTPNAIKVITSPPNLSAKEAMIPKKESSSVPVINAPLKLAFKTSAFKNNYNIHRDYVEPKETSESVNIYEKILLPSSPAPKPLKPTIEEQPYSICEKILMPCAPPAHYETSFDNKKHAVIKNIKFKLPAKYTNLKVNEKFSDLGTVKMANNVNLIAEPKTYTELKTVSPTSVIVNNHDLHWRKRTSQYLSSKDN